MRLPTSLQLVACLLTTGAVAAPVAGALAASGAGKVRISDCDRALTRPKSVTLTCADAGVVLTKLSWSSFGGTSARASGQIAINACEPNCAAGKTKNYPVRIIASRVKACRGKVSVYGQVAVTFTGAKPRDPSQFARYALACPT